MTVPLIRPDIGYDELQPHLEAILASGQLTGGPYLAEFEAAVAAEVGVGEAVATSSATTALHLVLAAWGIGPGDEVLVSDFTFPASGNVILQTGATPVLVDCEPDGFTIDVDDARAKVTGRTRALMVVEPFGQTPDLPALAALCADRGLLLVEDAACALGSATGGTACGAWGHAGCFSFHPRKVVTTGEGGAVTTADPDLAARLRTLRSHGGSRGPAVGLTFDEPGFNYRLAEVPAAMGVVQLRRLAAILDDRRATAARYDAALAGIEKVAVPQPGPDQRWSYQSYVVLLDPGVDRDEVVRAMADAGFETTLGTYAMHSQPAFAVLGYRPGDLPHSFRAQQQSLTLPLVPHMGADTVDAVVTALAGAVERSA